MAQATLTIVGSYFGGPIGAAIGSAIGSLIDNQLFPVKSEGPRLTDLSITTSSYGDYIPLLYGPQNRLAGKLMWTTGLQEHVSQRREGGKGGPSQEITEYTYTMSGAWLICAGEEEPGDGGEIDSVRKILMNGKLVYDADASPAVTDWGLWSSITIYPGNFTQTPDPTIEAEEGAGNAPAYLGLAYVVIADLQLADFGNTQPNIEFFVRKKGEQTLSSMVLDICTRAGLPQNFVSTSPLQDRTVEGMAIGNNSTAVAVIKQLGMAFDFDTAEESGSLRFVNRNSAPHGYIPFEGLAGHEANADRPEAIRWTRSPATDQPRQASVTYPDVDRDLQAGSQLAVRGSGSSQQNLDQELAISMDADLAISVADRMLWEAVNASQTAEADTDDRFIWVQAGRKYLFETVGGWEAYRVLEKTRGADGVIRLGLARDRNALYIPSSTGAVVPVPEQEVALPGETTLILLDAPMLQDTDDDTGFYWGVTGESSGWRGAYVDRSSDSGTSWAVMGSTGRRTAMGELETAMPSGSPAVWDRASTLRVRLVDPDAVLESRSELEVLNGFNAAWIGDWDGLDGEIIQFQNATQISDDLWEIDTFLRGRLGTEHAIGNSEIGHAFVPLNLGDLQRDDYGSSDWQKSRLYRAVSLLTEAGDADIQSFTSFGESKAPLSPVLASGSRDGSGDVLISWIRRSRFRSPGLGGGPLPIGEFQEEYELEIYDGATLVRTVTGLSSPEYDYTSALQTADGLTPGDPVDIVIYQVSDVRGRGRPGTFTV